MNKTTLSLAALALLSATTASFATEGGGSS